jgi:uncharacterized protein
MTLDQWEKIFEAKIAQVATAVDPAHDLLHFQRVVKTAKALCTNEGGKFEVVIPAAWLHDLVNVPKNDPNRSMASRLSAQAALEFLASVNYPQQFYPEIAHAIESHSFSAGITPKTIEAKIVQDADRLDGLGAIGVARCFATSGLLKRQFYSPLDPFCETREPNDQQFTVDHFFQKLFKTAETLQTNFGRLEGMKRVQSMQYFLGDLQKEIS